MEYKCLTRDRLGKVSTNIVKGRDVASVVSNLKKDGYLALKVEELKEVGGKKNSFFTLTRKTVKLKEIVIFTRQLAATLSAGLVLVEALEVVADEMENKYFQTVIRDIRTDIQGGVDFSTALSRYPQIFSVGYVSLVKAGEATGRLYKSMTDLARYLEDSMNLREKVKSALSYPAFVLGFSFVVVIVVVMFLIPKFKEIFVSVGADLPWLTQMVVGVSETAMNYWPFVLVGFIALAVFFRQGLKNYKFRFAFDNFVLRIPIIGKDIIHKSLMSRFSHTLSALLSGGVPLSTSLDITGQVVDHLPIKAATRNIRDRVVAGANMSDEIKAQPVFPSLVSKMVAVGERTGTISEMLRKTANYYDDELDNTLQKLTALIEPVLIIFIGGFICIIIVALYLPIFTVTRLVM